MKQEDVSIGNEALVQVGDFFHPLKSHNCKLKAGGEYVVVR